MAGKHLKEEQRIEIVKEVLAGVKVGVLARLHSVHPETIREWVRQYRDSISPEEIPSEDARIQEFKRLQEMELRYEKAMKVLGEKELELEILRELVKKSAPAYPKNSK